MSSRTRIAVVRGREILDSRGFPTVECDVTLESGVAGRASVPSGASTGRHEALELRDGDAHRFRGRGCRRAADHVTGELASSVTGLDAADQAAVDQALRDADGTPDKRRLGANAILAVSLAAARAAAKGLGRPLWKHLHEQLFPDAEPCLPVPMINILSGGHHAGFQLDIQDVLIFPLGAADVWQMIEWTSAIYLAVRDILRRDAGYTQLVADEGGFGPALESNEAMLRVVTEGIAAAGLEPGRDVWLALDIAATHFHRDGRYTLAADGRERDAGEMSDALEAWVEAFPVISIEDGLAEDDWPGWAALTLRLGQRVQVVGDDLFTTDVARLRRGVAEGCANSLLVKPNQVGTLSEAAEACRVAHDAGYTAVVSTRSGETADAFVVDLATASGAGQLKPGSLARSERSAKLNQLVRLEEELGPGWFTGARSLSRWRT
ncbi:MAG: phosphopyruvate hydratase [Armatimonadetes bacterium]|nr:phosphopyruvate hydratase [Armatimonadota bacterium]